MESTMPTKAIRLLKDGNVPHVIKSHGGFSSATTVKKSFANTVNPNSSNATHGINKTQSSKMKISIRLLPMMTTVST